MIGATIFLILLIALVGKMVWDVQMVKLQRWIDEVDE